VTRGQGKTAAILASDGNEGNSWRAVRLASNPDFMHASDDGSPVRQSGHAIHGIEVGIQIEVRTMFTITPQFTKIKQEKGRKGEFAV
jgi:hypothetical protein